MRKFKGCALWSAETTTADTMVLHCEVDAPSDALQEAIVTTIRDVCKLRAGVEFLSEGGLPDDGKVIDDKRPID